MRLLVVSQYFWPETFRINDLVVELIRRGHEVTVLTSLPNYPGGVVFPEFRSAPGRFSRFEGAEVIRVPLIPRGKGGLRLAANYLSFVVTGCTAGVWRLRGRRFDRIIVFSASPITGALPAIALRRLKRAPIALWILDLWPESLSAVGAVKAEWVLWLVGVLVRFIYRCSDLILPQSMAFLTSIERYGGDPRRVRYFPGWAESVFEGPGAEAPMAPEVAPYQGTFNVMFAGNIGVSQDFPSIVAAADLLRAREDIRWLIVGDGRAAAWVRTELARLGLEDRVLLLGQHPIGRMPAFFRGASALLVTLRDEPPFAQTIPGKVQAYLTTGLPILGMLNGEGARVLEESGAGRTCAAGDATGLARQVTELAAMSPEARFEMGRRGQAYSRREFDRTAAVDRLESWLAEAGAGRR